MEIERKWLIDINKIPYDLTKYESLDIKQAYISFSPTIRVREITNKNSYILTIKSASLDNGLSRQEYELYITKDEFDKLLRKKEGLVLNKTRYKIKEGDLTFEIDIFHDEYEGLTYLEVEFDSIEEANNFVSPSFVIKELTSLPEYTNSALAKGIDLHKKF